MSCSPAVWSPWAAATQASRQITRAAVLVIAASERQGNGLLMARSFDILAGRGESGAFTLPRAQRCIIGRNFARSLPAGPHMGWSDS